MDATTFLQRIQRRDFFDNQVVHVQRLPERPAAFAEVPGGLQADVQRMLAEQGIGALYRHQAEAVAQVRAGKNIVIVTGTASGKTLCYNIPVVETLREHSRATMLYIFPTKALAQDQLRGVGAIQSTGARAAVPRRHL